MGTENKLTYYAICSLAAKNRFDLIPSGYKIKWLFDVKPHKVIDMKLIGECIEFTNNDFAKPDEIKITGEYIVYVPSPNLTCLDDVEEVLEYGSVCLRTDFVLTELKFIYNNEKSMSMLNPYIARNFGYYGREPIKKSDVAFNAEIIMGKTQLQVFNALLKTYKFDDSNAVVDFDYDYFLLKV